MAAANMTARSKPSLFVRVVFITYASIVGTELLTGSTPVVPPVWLSPNFIILIALYGSAVLLVREAAVIWRKGWLSILAFGVAYGLIEEGIFAKTWFADLDFAWGKWLQVNWSFGIAEAIVEALFSIALPIALSRIAFPGSQSQRWLGNKSLIFVAFVFLVVVGMGFIATFRQYTQAAVQLPLALLMIAAFVFIGFSIGSPQEQRPPRRVLASPKILAPVYLIATLLVFLFAPVWMTPATPRPLPPLPAAAVAIAIVVLLFHFLHRTLLSPRQLFAAAAGTASAMFLVAIFGPQNARGAPIGVVLYVILLVYTWRRLRRTAA